MRGSRLALGVVLFVIAAPCAAGATPRIAASFQPNRLGADTAIRLGFEVGSTSSRLVAVALRLPREITTGSNVLGLATCNPGQLQTRGPRVCPLDSLIGRGKGVVSVPTGTEPALEPLTMQIFMAPAAGKKSRVLFYVNGSSPVAVQFVLEGSISGDARPFGMMLKAEIPEISGVPGAPPPTLVSMEAELGPRNLHYTKQVKGKTVTFVPDGFRVPSVCPVGGFPFAAELTFADGDDESASTRVACPRH